MSIMIDPDKCTGCKICELACSFIKEREFNPVKSRINVLSWHRTGLSIPTVCLQCDEAFCEKACPTGALSRNTDTGAVVVNEDRCVGCRLCTIACPIGAISIHPEKRNAIKCDLCNGDPECVKECPKEAITFEKDIVAIRAKRRESMGKLRHMLEMMSKA